MAASSRVSLEAVEVLEVTFAEYVAVGVSHVDRAMSADEVPAADDTIADDVGMDVEGEDDDVDAEGEDDQGDDFGDIDEEGDDDLDDAVESDDDADGDDEGDEGEGGHPEGAEELEREA